jgi:arylsulfatase A-like enzyme
MFRAWQRFPLAAAIVLPLVAGNSIHGAEQAAESGKKRPNVLFIAVDDLNDWTGFLGGQPGAKTPNLDRLAARGMVFTRAYCSAPACNPSRASLMCGVRPSTSGVYHNNQPWRPVLRDAVTLSQHFMANGYEAVGAGKIFHGGFDERESWNDYYKGKGEPTGKVSSNGLNAAHFDWGPMEASDEAMPDFQNVNFGIDYLSKEHDKPFFLAIGMIKPHLPWHVPQKYFDEFPLDRVELPKVTENDLADIPELGRRMARPTGDHAKVVAAGQWKQAVQGYQASIRFCDEQVGRLIDAFENSRYADNTIVVFWGDHGWHLGEKEHWRKFALWEEATRVPLVIWAPGVTQAGSRCERTVTLLDLYPTLVEYCGLSKRKGLEGNSIVPLLKSPQSAWDRPALTTHGRGNHAVRSERYRYIRYSDGSEELYDHQADPLEWKNLAGDPQYGSIKAELAGWLPKHDAPDAPKQGAGQQRRQRGRAS